MYLRFCAYISVCCLLLCTPFIADEELCRWTFDLRASSSSLLIAIICALPLWSFPYLIFLSDEFKGNPCINVAWSSLTSLCWYLTSDKWLAAPVDAWSGLDLIPLYFWDCDSVCCMLNVCIKGRSLALATVVKTSLVQNLHLVQSPEYSIQFLFLRVSFL
jgi:hypothetical protein